MCKLLDFLPLSLMYIIKKQYINILDRMSENTKQATKFIEQGHVRVGPEVVKDPAFIVNRSLEDFVTWVDGSAIRKHVLEYNEMVRFIWFLYFINFYYS